MCWRLAFWKADKRNSHKTAAILGGHRDNLVSGLTMLIHSTKLIA
jgi:hypothetical protein